MDEEENGTGESNGTANGTVESNGTILSKTLPARWRRFRVNAVQTCQVLLGRSRPLEEWEKEMFLFPRACRRCRTARREGMLDCGLCMGVTYCSRQCREEDEGEHEGRRCEELRFAMACDNFECFVNVAAPALPAELDRSYKPLPQDVTR